MCRFKSGIIFKNRVELAPMYNESHSSLLNRLGIEDNNFGASKVFVRAELIPPNADMKTDIDEWRFKVDQDIVPDWFENDQQRYEDEFRKAVKHWFSKNIHIICGEPCTKVFEDDDKEYYHTCLPLFEENHLTVEESLKSCVYAVDLTEKYGDRLVPLSFDLISMDGFNCGKSTPGILVLPTVEIYRKYRKNFFVGDDWWWLATPWYVGDDQDVVSASTFALVSSGGYAGDGNASNALGVRPLFALRKGI